VTASAAGGRVWAADGFGFARGIALTADETAEAVSNMVFWS
jgi:hypothetical protein